MFSVRQYESFDEVFSDIEGVKSSAQSNGYAILRGMVDPDLVSSAVARLREGFDPDADERRTLPFEFKRTPNFQQLDMGDYGTDIFRFMRKFFYFPWNGDALGLEQEWHHMATLRNLLMGADREFGLQKEGDAKDAFYTAFVNHYPLGGGFLSPHIDELPAYLVDLIDDYDRNFVVAMMMSQIGKDYSEGGGWMIVDNERTPWDKYAQLGDVLIYDQSKLHGVDPVDCGESIDLRSADGRLFCIVAPTSHAV